MWARYSSGGGDDDDDTNDDHDDVVFDEGSFCVWQLDERRNSWNVGVV